MASSPSPLFLFLFLSLLSLLPSSLSQQTLIPSEKQTLLQIKEDWGSPSALSSWNTLSISSNYCNWNGITCSPNGSVTQLILSDQNLDQTLPSSICNLKNLSYIDVGNNDLPGSFPTFISNCTALQYLDLSENYFVGELPSNIDLLLPKVTNLKLFGNNFAGAIPTSIGTMISLQYLELDNNNFNGSMPSFISNLINLESLTLAYNFFSPGPIPKEYGMLTNLTYIFMANLSLFGEIPDSLMQLSQLNFIDLTFNNLSGTIPPRLWSLKNLESVFLHKNNFSGEITFVNGSLQAENLVEIDLSMNQLTGPFPQSFGTLKNLSRLHLYYNNLSGEIPKSIGLLTKLTDLRLFNNKLTGILPQELGRHSPLWNVEVDDNMLTGEIPKYICYMQKFTSLVVFDNNMTGTIPQSIGECPHLDNIQVQNNQFSGDVPAGLWSLQNLTTILMSNNMLTGELPSSLQWNVTRLEIQNNQFSGKIPVSASGLRVFLAGNNNFSGEISPELPSGMPYLQRLDLSQNGITGVIPISIGSLKSLNTLDFSHNEISGQIPASIATMPDLSTLDLSSNKLSGEIPPAIGNMRMSSLNLSLNDLSGTIPSGIDNKGYDQSFLSNPRLCSSVSMNGIKSCSSGSNGSDGVSHKLRVIFIVLGTVLFVIILSFAAIVIRDYNKRKEGSDLATWKLTSFQSLNFTENNILRGIKEENLIGAGGTGRVYSVAIENRAGEIVAVKKIYSSEKLDSKLERDFESEVKVLGSIRHINIVKLLCCISSPDSKLLVYEYMENSSLDKWLHGNKRALNGPLDWATRLEIAIGAARGLCYMHHECLPPIVHRDVKSSNILLDTEFKVKIADFGLARILAKPGVPDTVSVVAGSFGYMAPECAYTRKVNEKVDVYSFGVVLLELTTGREANDGGAHNNLAEWAWRHAQQGNPIRDVIEKDIRNPAYLDEIEMVFKLGLVCTSTRPSNRPSMKEVLDVLLKYDVFNQRGGDKERGTDHDAAPLLYSKNGSRKNGSRKKSLQDDDCEGLACNV